MIYYLELWSAKPTWLALSTAERNAYMAKIGPHIQGLIDQGAQILSWSANAPSTTKRIAYDYFAIWSFPNHEVANQFETLVTGAGWYDYFEQVNAMGEQDSVENVIGALINL